MPRQDHLDILDKGKEAWNAWRKCNSEIVPLLRSAPLEGRILSGYDLHDAYLRRAHLKGANLDGCGLREANLSGADLRNASMVDAKLTGANLRAAKMQGANLCGADFKSAILVNTDLRNAKLTGAQVYGISAWDVLLDGAEQSALVLSHPGQPRVTTDDLEVAQFVYLLLNRKKLRNIIDTITSKVVLILGRFTPERKTILDAIAGELRQNNLIPVIFDFEGSKARDFTETIKLLAAMSLFVIVDLTNPRAAPLELQATVPDYQIPFVPIIEEGEEPFSMFKDLLNKYDWVLQVLTYKSKENLMQVFRDAILERAWEKHKELRNKKTQQLAALSADDFLKVNLKKQ